MPGLNPEQKQAAQHGEGPLLVVAGPGSGKTRVITERIVYLLGGGYASGGQALGPDNILALTFTEKAAGEMKHRVAAALPSLDKPPHISTFHAFCLETLRNVNADRPLLDKIDVWIFLRRRMAELGLEFYRKLAEPGAFLHDLNDFFSRCQDELIEPEDFGRYVIGLERRFQANAAMAAAAGVSANTPGRDAPALKDESHLGLAMKKELSRVFAVSRHLIEASGAVSLGSLVSETVALWRRDPKALEDARARYRAVLVDEFQDTNYAQVELLKLLVPPPYAITAVGDDDQAIYRFRGASYGAFEMFSEAFPGHRTVCLSRNYRSTAPILHAASALIAHNDRYAGKPPLSASRESGLKVCVIKTKSPESEAEWIAGEIERLAAKGVPYGGIAVLYRAHNYRDLLVSELRARGVPLSIRGLSVISTTVLRDLVAYLRVIQSPHDSISLTRILLAPCWGVTEELAQSFRDAGATHRTSLYDAIQTAAGEARAALAQTSWAEFEELRTAFRKVSLSLPLEALVDRLVKRLGWVDDQEAPGRAYLEAFSSFVKQWEEKSETKKLAEFIEYFDYFIEAGGKIEAPQPAERAVQLMTVHAAKGLEFPAVFIIGVSPRRFPPVERKPVIEFPPELRNGPEPPRDIHLQEERRLFFVAMTRAKDRLYVSSVSKSDRQQSAFIQDLISDPAVRARDLEIIDVPEPAPPVETRRSPRVVPSTAPSAVGSRAASSVAASQGNLFQEGSTAALGLHADIAAWAAKEPPELPKGNLRLSATAVEDYLACPLKYKFQHVLKIPTAAQAPLTFGNLMHRDVRYYFELRRELAERPNGSGDGLPAPGQVEQFFLDHWNRAGFDDAYQEETYRQAGIEQLRGFVEKHNAIALDPRAIEMERSFEFALGDITLEGRIDQITHLEANGMGVELIDYKTGRPRTDRDADKSLQLSIYALASREALGLDASKLTLYNLTNNEAVSSVRNAGNLRSATDDIRRTADEIRKGRFEATPGYICRWCGFVTICPGHER